MGCKGSENRAKCKEKNDFSFISEMHPTFDRRSEVRIIERKTKYIRDFSEKNLNLLFFDKKVAFFFGVSEILIIFAPKLIIV